MTGTPRTIMEFVDAGFAKNTTGIACATKRRGTWINTSIDAFRQTVDDFALGLHGLGVRRGDRVALHAENSAEWLIVDQAVLRLGAVTVPIYATQPPDQIRYILEDSEACAYVVSTGKLHAPLKHHLRGSATLQAAIGILGSYDNGMHAFADVVERGRQRQGDAPTLLQQTYAAIAPDDLATLVYTSGTTGQPKGVMLTHDNIVFDALATLHSLPFDPEEHRGGTILSYLPLSHAYERMIGFLALYIGYPLYFVEDVNEIREDFSTVRPIHLTTVPRLLEKVQQGIHDKAETLSRPQKALMQWALGLAESYDVEAPMSGADRLRYAVADRLVFRKIRTLFGGRLVSIIAGGAALAPGTMNFFNALGVYCGQGYGMTETSPVITTTTPGATRAGSVGKPLRGVEVAIAGDGEILTRGRHVTKGYFKLPDQTAAVMSADGWFRTGDIGHLDEDGYLYITDRKKELFKLSTGKYVAPAAIEIALAQSVFIESAVVVGNAHKFCAALVVPDAKAIRYHLERNGGSCSDVELCANPQALALIQREVDAINAKLPDWEQVKRFCLLAHPFSIDGGELTPTLKVKRRVIHERYRREIESMYA